MTYKQNDFNFWDEGQKEYGRSFNIIFNDLLGDTFDVTWNLNLSNPQNKIFSIIPPELNKEIVDDKSVLYQYNEDFFRSDNFKTVHDGKHILFSGCSETEGVGGNIEDAWSYMLYSKISKEEKCSGFFNLAKSGWGWSRIILNALIYFKKYGYPDSYFICLPNHQRKFYYKEKFKNQMHQKLERNVWTYFQTYPEFYEDKNTELSKFSRVSDPKEYLEDFVFFLINWKTFCELCKSNNVNLIFSTWDPTDADNLKPGPFDEFFKVDIDKTNKYFYEYYKTHEVEKDDQIKRDGHAGRIIHSFYANEFYEQYKKRGFDVN